MEKPKANRRRTFGEPDAGKPPVRFDEGWRENAQGTDNYGHVQSLNALARLLYYLAKPRVQNPAQGALDDDSAESSQSLHPTNRPKSPFRPKRPLARTNSPFVGTGTSGFVTFCKKTGSPVPPFVHRLLVWDSSAESSPNLWINLPLPASTWG
jgi:hypothetical protein